MTHELHHFGELFIVGLAGARLLDEERRLLALLRPAGIILFKKNIDHASAADWSAALNALIEDVRRATARPEMLISVDHEGGKVHRLPAPVTHFPAARGWGARSGLVGKAMGRELRALGINLSFAPVLDIHSEPENTVIGARAFGTNPGEVIQASLDFLSGLQSEGVLGCGKHFPGHGATLADSHYELPRLTAGKEMLLARELLPFAAAISAGIGLVMTAHVHYPALDPDAPATISGRILTDILRSEMGFLGAVISDDLEMAALASLSPQEKAVQCVAAGVDLLLEGNPKAGLPVELAAQMAEGLKAAVESGRLAEDAVAAARHHVRGLFLLLRALEAGAPPADPAAVGHPDHTALAESLR